jgi:hypothetical protein
VVHAYREHHGLTVITPRTEEELTDLTTIYLGFGVLPLNASYISRSNGRIVGGWVTHRYEVAGPRPTSSLDFHTEHSPNGRQRAELS